ncbi:hypothetical protein [Haladaptatus sp. DYSN1]|uniref:hypothetical protein n=1 Tax=unclassified Haladaptatus TaxID=2622732 RepID=UPI00240698A9|nr:hypothetical protein [Haladaptatus sp. DYSN1]
MNRRMFLGITAGVGLASLAGCGSVLATVPAPEVSKDKLEAGGWKLIDERDGNLFTERYSGATVSAAAHTLTFEDRALADTLAERTLDTVDAQMAVFFAGRVDFSPDLDDLPAAVGRKEVMEQVKQNAKADFETRLEDAGLTDISEGEATTFTPDTGETGELVEYTARFPFEGFTFDVTTEKSVAISGGDIAITGWLAIWHHGDSTLVAGGAAPAENYAESLTEELSSGVSVTVDIDLGLEPDAYSEEIFSLMRSVR